MAIIEKVGPTYGEVVMGGFPLVFWLALTAAAAKTGARVPSIMRAVLDDPKVPEEMRRRPATRRAPSSRPHPYVRERRAAIRAPA